MANRYSMKELLQKTEDKYGDFEFDVPVLDEDGNDKVDENGNDVVETATFLYYLRIDLESRKKLTEAYDYVANPDKYPDQEGDGLSALTEFLKDTVRSLAKTERDYELVSSRLGDDFILWSFFIETYEKNYADAEEDMGESKPSRTS